MKFMRNHWYDLCGICAIIAGVLLTVFWKQLNTIQILMWMNFIVILLHQFEEYRFPGGGQAMPNTMRRGYLVYDRYPLNQNNAMLGNLFIAFTSYLIPIFLPNVMWLGIVPMVFGLVQIIPHVFVGSLNLKTLYTPGFLTTVFGFVPIGVYYLYYIISNDLASTQDWIFSAIYLILFMGVIYYLLFYVLLADKNSPYPFTEEELNRFHMLDKIRAAQAKKAKNA